MDDLTRRNLAYLRDHESCAITEHDREWLAWLIRRGQNISDQELAVISRIRAGACGRRF